MSGLLSIAPVGLASPAHGAVHAISPATEDGRVIRLGGETGDQR